MSEFQTLLVKEYRVINGWTNETLLETRDFQESVDAKEHHQELNQHDEIIVVAVIDA